LICFLCCPWNSKHSSEKSHFYGFQFLLNLLVYSPCLASIHQYRFDIALQGSLPCVYRQLGIRQDGLHFWKHIFAWPILDDISLSFRPSLDIKLPRYLKDLHCLSGDPLMKMLHVGVSAFRLTTITSVFLQFSSKPFLWLSLTTMSRRIWRSFSFSAISTVSSAYLRLFIIFPPNLMPGKSSKSLRIFSLYRENNSGDRTHPCLTHIESFQKS